VAHSWFVFWVGPSITASLNGRIDLDVTKALRSALDSLSVSSRRKAITFLKGFLKFAYEPNEAPDAFIAEPVMLARLRVETFLEKLGYKIVQSERYDGACYVVRKAGRGTSSLSVGINALARFYARLHKDGLRPKANPIKIDGFHELTAGELADLAAVMKGSSAEGYQYRGTYYIANDKPASPLRLEDTEKLGPEMLAAGRQANWPASVIDLVTLLEEDGCRFDDAHQVNAADWARASQFGRKIDATNKGSKRKRVKVIVLSSATVLQLRASFDNDPDRPTMRKLQYWLAEGKWARLEATYLFPSSRGTPFAYSTVNNHYIRPAMEEHGVTAHSESGEVRATLHRLRSGAIQRRVLHLLRQGLSEELTETGIKEIMADFHIKSRKAFERYLGPVRLMLGEEMKMRRFDKMRDDREAQGKDFIPTAGRISDLQRQIENYR
jgi:hypothetical protein